jgi:Methyltransferase FkbM domain
MFAHNDATKNMSFYSRIRSYYNFLHKYFQFFSLFRKRYTNYLTVMFKVLKRQYPINAILKTGHSVVFDDYSELYSNLLDLECDVKNDVVNVDGLKFYGGVSNADSISSFIQKEYDFLPVKEKVVIDIGANIGDSSIYFVLKGARRVIAIEPDPQICQFAIKNIELNGFSDRIELMNVACSSIDTIDQDFSKPTLITLQGIIDQCSIKPSILKIDCEGCEYDVILSATSNTLLNFTHIQIEYHHGYKNLKKKLEEYGFQVKVTEPSYFISLFSYSSINKYVSSDNKVTRVNKTYSGMLYASRA